MENKTIDQTEKKKRKSNHKDWTLKSIKDRCIEVGDCWIWTQSILRGNPRGSVDGERGVMVRRWVWLYTHNNKEPKNFSKMCVISTCGEKTCCNPDHLRLVTRGEINLKAWSGDLMRKLQMGAKARKKVLKVGWAKITMEEARKIRLDNRPVKEIAKDYKIGTKTVYDIKNNLSWKEHTLPYSIFNLGSSI